MKKAIRNAAAVIIVAGGLSLTAPALAQGRQNRAVDEIHTQSLMVDGRPVETEVRPRTIGGTVMVPLRFMAEYMGAKVDWNPARRAVRVQREKPSREVMMNIGSTRATMNGEGRTLTQAPVIYRNRTLIPLKDVATYLNASVIYNPQTRTVFVETNPSTGRPSTTILTPGS